MPTYNEKEAQIVERIKKGELRFDPDLLWLVLHFLNNRLQQIDLPLQILNRHAENLTDLPAPRMKPGQFCVYVLKGADGSFYIGQTENFRRRFDEHCKGEVSWTASKLPVEAIHWEIFNTREEAVKRERDLKTGFGRKWLKREYKAGCLALSACNAQAEARQAGLQKQKLDTIRKHTTEIQSFLEELRALHG